MQGQAGADPLRFATFNIDLNRSGPGLALRDLAAGKDPQIAAIAEVVTSANPDILAVQGLDWDHGQQTLAALVDVFARAGLSYPHSLTLEPNTGRATGLDMDGDGRTGEPRDAQSYGRFTGQGGMALLSRVPIAQVTDHSGLLWSDLDWADPPRHADGSLFPSLQAFTAQRLPYVGLWEVTLDLPQAPVVLMFQAAPPVFDGPEDRNGRRNADELRLLARMVVPLAAKGPVIVTGGANLDPFDSDGRRSAIQALLSHPALTDPRPASPGGAQAGDQGHDGPGALDTVDWPNVGRFRVDYVLPSRDIEVTGAGVWWPAPDTPGHEATLAASRHRLVWLDLRFE